MTDIITKQSDTSQNKAIVTSANPEVFTLGHLNWQIGHSKLRVNLVKKAILAKKNWVQITKNVCQNIDIH